MFRFLTYVLMLIPSNVNIPNGFTNICLITNTRSVINLARWVRVLLFQRKQTFNFLSDPLNSHLNPLIGELIQLWQESLSYEPILWAIWKLHQYWFFRNFKKIRWSNLFTFLLLSFILLMLIISDDTICERWRVICFIKLLMDYHLFVIEVWPSALHKSPWIAFRLYLFGILEDQCGIIFVILQSPLVVIELFL